MKLGVLLLAAMMLALAAPASACYFGTVTPSADCSGWTVCGTVLDSDHAVNVIVKMTLLQGNTVISTVWDTVTVGTARWDFCVSGSWKMELCGDYTAYGWIWFDQELPDARDFSVPFNCPCGGGGCHYTPGYWKNHAENWPLTSLVIGGVTYNQSQLLGILNTPTRKDATIICAHHLIAAMLNVAGGADNSIQGKIDAANALLTTYPVGSNPPKPQRQWILDVKDDLCAYNETIVPGCGCSTPPGARVWF